MPDRDNVIKRLEECLSASCRGFRTCPYSDNEWDAVETALALLRERETVEPVVHCKDANLSNGADFACSGCGGSFLHKVVNFCPWCGKKVKWDARTD